MQHVQVPDPPFLVPPDQRQTGGWYRLTVNVFTCSNSRHTSAYLLAFKPTKACHVPDRGIRGDRARQGGLQAE
jgi:hypothetical protein